MLARRPKSAQAMAMRARIVLSCGQGLSNAEVARMLHLTGATVGKWRERFREFGLDGLLDEPRAGAPRKITDPSPRRWNRCPPGPRTGALASWLRKPVCRRTPSCASGMPLDCSPIAWRASSSPKTRSGEGEGHRWLVFEPAGSRDRAVHGRKESGPRRAELAYDCGLENWPSTAQRAQSLSSNGRVASAVNWFLSARCHLRPETKPPAPNKSKPCLRPPGSSPTTSAAHFCGKPAPTTPYSAPKSSLFSKPTLAVT